MSHFTDIFEVPKEKIDEYGAFNVSLLSDLPLFIDPFLLFNSDKPEYQQLHKDIIAYLTFLREKSVEGKVTDAGIARWFMFQEVKQNWLGYTLLGNGGSALGPAFGRALNASLSKVLSNVGQEDVTKSSHLEKVCLLGRGENSKRGVGKDNISDFTVNLIKDYLLTYTEKFAVENIDQKFRQKRTVPKAFFDYKFERWMPKTYELPVFNGDFVVLTPRDMLTREDTWINKKDLIDDFYLIAPSIPNDALRESIEDYFSSQLPPKPKRPDEKEAAAKTIQKYPEFIDYYIKYKEENGEQASSISKERVEEGEDWFVRNVQDAVRKLQVTKFYEKPFSSYSETLERAKFFKDRVENGDVYTCFYDKSGKPIDTEEHANRMFHLLWYNSVYDYNSQVNNGRGPVDGTVSLGSIDKTLIEFKIAANTHIKQGFEKQVPIYEKANRTSNSVTIVMCYNASDRAKIQKLLTELGWLDREDIVVVDADNTNKPSASKA